MAQHSATSRHRCARTLAYMAAASAGLTCASLREWPPQGLALTQGAASHPIGTQRSIGRTKCLNSVHKVQKAANENPSGLSARAPCLRAGHGHAVGQSNPRPASSNRRLRCAEGTNGSCPAAPADPLHLKGNRIGGGHEDAQRGRGVDGNAVDGLTSCGARWVRAQSG